jgi:hypothetical protein
LLTSLVVLIVIMLLGILASSLFAPGSWHKRFKVDLGLDLSSGTTVTLAGQRPKSMDSTQFSQAMSTAVTIMNNRVDGAGFSGATVVPQGSDLIVVTVPGKNYQQVVGLVGTTAQLRFRQVLRLRGDPVADADADAQPHAHAEFIVVAQGQRLADGVVRRAGRHQLGRPQSFGHRHAPDGCGRRCRGRRERFAQPVGQRLADSLAQPDPVVVGRTVHDRGRRGGRQPADRRDQGRLRQAELQQRQLAIGDLRQ